MIEATVAAAVAAATTRYAAGDFGGAAALLDPLLPEHEAAPDLLRLAGLCRLRLGDAARAEAMLARARRLAPADPWSMLHHGVALDALGRHAEAAGAFRDSQAGLPTEAAPALNLASVLLVLNDAAGAIQAARRARLRAPELPAAHYMLGLAHLAASELEAARASFTKAVKLRPDFADAWVNLGAARYRQGDMRNATAAMRRALALAPRHRAATANLAGFLRLQGDHDGSSRLLRDLLEQDPAAMEVRIMLAAALLLEERPDEAAALLEQRPPDGAAGELRVQWQLQMSQALLLLGRVEECREILAAIEAIGPALAPMLSWRRLLLARADGDAAAALKLAEQMQAQLDHPAVLPEHAIMGEFELGRFWSARRQPARAFTFWQRGHRRMQLFQPFSREAFREFVDASIAAFDAERLREGVRADSVDPAPVFIVGMPRSGTTLAEQILAAHGQVYGAGERGALDRCFSGLAGARETAAGVRQVANTGAARLNAAATRYLARLHALAPEAARVVDKMPGNLRLLGLVGVMLPGARIIECRRDPRDIGLSILTFRFHGTHPYAHDLADLGWYIGESRRLMAHWHRVLPNPIMTLRLTDWIGDFDGTLGRVLRFLDLPDDPNCARFHELEREVRTVSRKQVRQPVNARGIGRWRPFAEQLAPMIAELEAAGALEEEYIA